MSYRLDRGWLSDSWWAEGSRGGELGVTPCGAGLLRRHERSHGDVGEFDAERVTLGDIVGRSVVRSYGQFGEDSRGDLVLLERPAARRFSDQTLLDRRSDPVGSENLFPGGFFGRGFCSHFGDSFGLHLGGDFRRRLCRGFAGRLQGSHLLFERLHFGVQGLGGGALASFGRTGDTIQ